MMQFLEERKKGDVQSQTIPDECGFRLYMCADSLRELAKSFEKKKVTETQDRRACFEEERLRENCDVIAGHLTELAQIMEQTADEVAEMTPLEEKTWKKLNHALREKGICLEGACLLPSNEYGRKLSLSLHSAYVEGVQSEEVLGVLEKVFEQKYCLSFASPEWITRESALFHFAEQPKYMAFTGFARVVKGREEISGDNYSILQSECGKLTLLLSDGTGSGQQACDGSDFVLDLVERLLEAGYRQETALRMVNSTILAKGEELGHPTLDMCRLDLQKGSCDFCKAGGAVSFCKRGEEVEVIPGGQLPLGIFQDLEPHRNYYHLEEGDSVILMTDGVLEAFREKGYEEAVRNALSSMKEAGPREIAEKLMHLAIFASEGNIRDDMTILVATLWKTP